MHYFKSLTVKHDKSVIEPNEETPLPKIYNLKTLKKSKVQQDRDLKKREKREKQKRKSKKKKQEKFCINLPFVSLLSIAYLFHE